MGINYGAFYKDPDGRIVKTVCRVTAIEDGRDSIVFAYIEDDGYVSTLFSVHKDIFEETYVFVDYGS